MSASSSVKVTFLGDASQLARVAQQASASTDAVGKKASKMGAAMKAAAVAAGAALVKFGVDSVKSASNAEQALGGVQSVFGDAAKTVEGFSSRSARAIGLAGQDYQTLAATVGSQLQRMGKSQQESAVETDKLITMGADLAATFGGSVSDAVSAVGSLLRGERDPIERYGVGINEATIKAKLMQQGLGGLKGAALEQAKAQATLTLLTEQTKNAQGAAGRESNTLQGQSQRLSAQYKDLSASVGAKMLPVLTTLAEKLREVMDFTERNRAVIVPLVAVLGGLAAAVYVVNTAAKAYTAVQAALNVVMALNPVGLVVIAIAALAAGLVIAYKKSETFRDIVNGAFVKVLGAVDAFLGGIQKMLQVLGKIPGFEWADKAAAKVKGARDAVQGLADKIAGVKSKTVTVTVITREVMASEAKRDASKAANYYSARANGGPVMPGQPYLVGEKGPELIVPRSAGHVMTAKETAGLGGNTYNYNLSLSGEHSVSTDDVPSMFRRMELLAGAA